MDHFGGPRAERVRPRTAENHSHPNRTNRQLTRIDWVGTEYVQGVTRRTPAISIADASPSQRLPAHVARKDGTSSASASSTIDD